MAAWCGCVFILLALALYSIGADIQNDDCKDKSKVDVVQILLQKITEMEKQHKQEIERLATRLEQVEKQLQPRVPDVPNYHGNITRRAGSGPFAFHVVLNQDITGLEHSQIIPFGTVVTNDGQAYDKNSGVFRCQQDGTYLFAVTVVVYPRKGTELSLVKNGVGIGDVYAQSNSDRYDSGSNVFIVHLQVGDQVFVQVHDHYHGTGNVIDASFTTFSGFLIN